MKNIKRLKAALLFVESNSGKRKELAVYLAIVFLGLKIPEVAQQFQLSENKVQHYLCLYGVKLNSDKVFYAKMHKATKIFAEAQQQLKLVG